MNPIIRNILAVLAGIAIGSIVNGGIIEYGGAIIAPPAGVDPTDFESIKANIHLYEAKHFAIPLLAHALGTLLGAIVTCLIAASHHKQLALIIGACFFVGGLIMAYILPHNFAYLDLLLAYFPMGLLGWLFTGKKTGDTKVL